MQLSEMQTLLTRRRLLASSAAALAGAAAAKIAPLRADEPRDGSTADRKPTLFKHACMTLPYSDFPLERALSGIAVAGYRYIAWGVTHREAGGEKVPVMAEDASPAAAGELAKRCRDLGLEPVMMFSTVYPEDPRAPAVFKNRILQAEAAGIAQVLTFGHTEGGNRGVWVERFKQLGPIAADRGVTIVVKQHGGSTGTGAACAEIIREVDHPNVWVNYDAGNVMDYLDLDPIADLKKCAAEVRSFCVKDHRNWPADQDCGPGFGEIDHYRLLEPVAFTGLAMPLAYENISAPLLPRPAAPEGVDALARRAREYLETVIAGLQAA